MASSQLRSRGAAAGAVGGGSSHTAAGDADDDTSRRHQFQSREVDSSATQSPLKNSWALWSARLHRSRCAGFVVLPAGLLLRFLLAYAVHALGLYDMLSSRLELTNALVSFRAVRESLAHVQRPIALGGGGGGLSPYAGISCSHATPLVLWVLGQFVAIPLNAADEPQDVAYYASATHLALLAAFTLMDLTTAWAIFHIATEANRRASAYIPRALAESMSRMHQRLPVIAAATFLLNPFTVASCAILNLSSFSQLVLSTLLLSALRGRFVASSVLLAIAAYLDLYPLLIVVPILLLLHRAQFASQLSEYPQYRSDKFIDHDACQFVLVGGESATTESASQANAASASTAEETLLARQQILGGGGQPKRILRVAYQPIALPEDADEGEDKSGIQRVSSVAADASISETSPKWNVPFLSLCVLLFTSTLAFLVYLSYLLSGSSFSFLSDSWGYTLLLPSLSPTYSIFWYFFTSLFSRFHAFFLVIFHSHMLVYLIPLVMRFWEEPLFLVTILLHLATIFKAYPTLAELIFTGTLLVLVNLPLLRSTLRRIYPLIFLSVVSLLTLMLMQYLWLQTGSGNANFFFFQNLLYLFTHLFGCMECIGAVRRLQAQVMEGRIKETTARRYRQSNTPGMATEQPRS